MRFSSILLIAVVGLVLAAAVYGRAQSAKVVDNPSYGVLALQNVAGSFLNAVTLLASLNNTAQPGSVKPVRKSILSARNGLDVFVYAYPPTDGRSLKKEDVFSDLRDDLDAGYTLIGDFQDLGNVNYTQKDYQQRLNACLTWKTNFSANYQKYNYKNYVLSASTNKIFDRKKAALSKDYWRYVNATPSLALSGYQNVATLADGQLAESVIYYDSTYNLTDIWDTKYHIQFHDYRKLLRAINFVGTEYPQIYSSDVSASMALVNTAYGSFGDLNDLITEYEYYESKGDKGNMEKLQKEIISSWADLKQWLTSNNFRQLMTVLPSKLIPH